MAKINTTFAFQDKITSGLAALTQTLNSLNKTLSSVKGSMGGMNDTLDETQKKTKSVYGGISNLASKLLSFNLAVQTFHTVKGAIDGVIGSVGGLNAMWQAQMDSEARLSAVMQARFHSDVAGIQDMTKYINDFSKGSAYNKTMLTNAAQELGTYIESADTLKGLLPMLTSMSQQAGITNEQGLMSMATMIGKVMGGDMGGLSKRGWQFTEQEKDAFKTMSELERLNFLVNTAKENIGEQDKAIADMMSNLARQRNLEDLQMKLGGLMNPFMDAVGQASIAFKTGFYERIVPVIEKVSPYIQAIGQLFVDSVDLFYSTLDNIKNGIISFVNFVQSHANQIVIIITAAISATIAALVALGVHFVIVQRQAIIAGLKSVGAALKSAAAWVAANIAMIGIIAAIIAVIAAIGLLLAFSSKTFPAIAGFFSGIGKAGNAIAHNIKVVFLSAIEGIVNGFLQMKDKVSDFFLSMLDTIMSGVAKIAPVIDAVFHTNTAKSIGDFRTQLNAMKATPADTFAFADKGEMWDIGAHYRIGKINGQMAGAEASDKFQKWIGDKIDGVKNLLPKLDATDMSAGIASGIADGLDEKLKTDGSGALITSDKGVLDISNDYRELLTQAATRRFNMKFQSVAPNITVQGVHFGENADFDTFIEKLTDKIEDVSNSSIAS